LQDRYNIPKKRLCIIVNKLTSDLIKNIEATKYFWKELNYSGNHVVDGKYVPVKKEIDIGTDLLSSNNRNGKIPKSRKRRKIFQGKVLI